MSFDRFQADGKTWGNGTFEIKILTPGFRKGDIECRGRDQNGAWEAWEPLNTDLGAFSLSDKKEGFWWCWNNEHPFKDAIEYRSTGNPENFVKPLPMGTPVKLEIAVAQNGQVRKYHAEFPYNNAWHTDFFNSLVKSGKLTQAQVDAQLQSFVTQGQLIIPPGENEIVIDLPLTPIN